MQNQHGQRYHHVDPHTAVLIPATALAAATAQHPSPLPGAAFTKQEKQPNAGEVIKEFGDAMKALADHRKKKNEGKNSPDHTQ